VTDQDSDGHDDLLVRFRPSSLSLLSTSSVTALFNATTTDGVLLFARAPVDADDYSDVDADGIIDPCDP
jgi:hypothetical protein